MRKGLATQRSWDIEPAKASRAESGTPMKIIVYGDPVAKPRQTRRDKWAKRPCVLAYRAWADLARYTAFNKNEKLRLTRPTVLAVRAWFGSATHRSGPHTMKPDADNVLKAVADALFTNDEMIDRATIEKRWADGSSPRVEIEWI